MISVQSGEGLRHGMEVQRAKRREQRGCGNEVSEEFKEDAG
eukprot:CAMPEP_0204898940 /NCGR_PEP_ID=MMETSP1397-20131031/1569_1 /ASSEMBLY_ACC=CAM_ASM_000891 /TAXON_ID=49980 /ORGANISM="Climacostomum Climacostomum virens, Strain Stock W-24" /LENGTH=40 /DNA_ID= /DNA_START= /DNA_END= /DNA_ORIENTATION=